MRVDWRKFVPLVLIGAGLWAYHNSLSGPFIFDDRLGIVANPSIRHLWAGGEVLAPPLRCGMAGRPVANFTFALNYALGGLAVRGYHLVNLAIHLLASLVLCGIVRRTLHRERFGGGDETVATVWALLAVLVWTVHPLLTESVTYVSQRTELLMGLFLLLTLYCVIRAADSTRPRAWPLAAVAACGLGMASKEVMVVAPLLVFAYDVVFLTGSARESLKQRGGLYAGLAASWALSALLVAGASFQAKTGSGFELITPWHYALTQGGVIAHYLRLCFWPSPLVIDYDDWPVATSLGSVLPAALLVVALLTMTAWGLWRRRWWGFAGLWFFLILAPTSSFLPLGTEVAAERRMYLPAAAVMILVVIALGNLMERLRWRREAVAMTAVLALALGTVTGRRNDDYRSAVAIWSDAVNKRPGNYRARLDLGAALARQGEPDRAVGQYKEALRLNPRGTEAYYNWGLLRAASGQTVEAIDLLKQARHLEPSSVPIRYNLGVLLAQHGDLDNARAELTVAVGLDPGDADAQNSLGVVLAKQGQTRAAIRHFAAALRAAPDHSAARANLQLALAQTNQPSRARVP